MHLGWNEDSLEIFDAVYSLSEQMNINYQLNYVHADTTISNRFDEHAPVETHNDPKGKKKLLYIGCKVQYDE